MVTYPYIFIDQDEWSETFNKFCVRLTSYMSIDGFETEEEAENYIKENVK